MLTRLACPPDMPRDKGLPITVFRQDSKFNILIISATHAFRSSDVVFTESLSSAVYSSLFVIMIINVKENPK
jgi:hypothetical protein